MNRASFVTPEGPGAEPLTVSAQNHGFSAVLHHFPGFVLTDTQKAPPVCGTPQDRYCGDLEGGR